MKDKYLGRPSRSSGTRMDHILSRRRNMETPIGQCYCPFYLTSSTGLHYVYAYKPCLAAEDKHSVQSRCQESSWCAVN